MKGILTKLLLVAMLLSALSGFSAAIAEDLSQQTIEWTFYSDYQLGADSPDDAYVKQQIEEEFNVKINYEMFTGASGEYGNALNLRLASGSIPDVFKISKYSDLVQYAEQGILAEIDPAILYENAPRLMSYVDGIDEQAWLFTNVDGKNYGMPNIWPLGDHSRVNVIREDWLDKFGLSIPTTIDEFEVVLEKFRNEDPDGNGLQDTYPIGTYINASVTENLFPGLFGMFGSHPDLFLVDDEGQVYYGAIDSRTKDALEKLHEWYEKGYIDPEFQVDTADTWKEKWNSGKQGYVASSYWWTTGPAAKYFSGGWYDPLVQANPDAKVTNFPPMTGPNGDRGLKQLAMTQVIEVIGFGKQLEDKPEVIKRWLQVQDVLQNDPYWAVLIYDGIEGETFTRNEDNTITYTEDFNTTDKRYAYGAGGVFSVAPNYDIYDTATKDMNYVNAQRANAIGPVDALKNYPLEASLKHKTNLRDITVKAYIDFITGNRPLTEWDAFVEQWKSVGGQEVLDEAQKVYAEVFK